MFLMDMTLDELETHIKGEPKYRAAQVRDWLLRGARPEQMTNIPLSLRERLKAIAYGGAVIRERCLSKIDDTEKYLFELDDGELVEGVLMRYRHGNTLCLSTQVGCRMGCTFCASTLEGLKRHIRHGEMLSMLLAPELLHAKPDAGRVVTNIVLMGSGEPLDNYYNVLTFLKRVVSELSISARNISLSTCGLAPEIYRLAREAPPVTLAVSLHAHSDAVRDLLVPMNKRYTISEVLEAASFYADKTGRRIIIEYALIDGVNASKDDAKALSSRLRGLLCHVNLIPLNTVKESSLRGVDRRRAQEFAGMLEGLGISATVRREMGADIDGACGQLRRRVLSQELDA